MPTSQQQILLLILLVKILAAASIASVLARSGYFRRLLFSGQKQLVDHFVFGMAIGVPLMFGVLLRVLLGYRSEEHTLNSSHT